MINETFIASNPQNAYTQAVKKYGKNIKFISAKQIKYEDGTLRSEITIAVRKKNFMKKSLINPKEEEEILLSELQTLKKQLFVMKEDMLENSSETVVKKVKTLFMKKGIAEVWLDDVLSTLMGNNILEDANLLASFLLEEIDESLKVQTEKLDESKIVMLVGPTGVGKTTTIAKLAARYAYLSDSPYKVALLNLDNYKVGAHEQLAHYADIMQIEHIAIRDKKDFLQCLKTLNDYDLILIDTAGMSPYDTKKFIKMVEFVQSDISKKLEINLVLSATVKYEDMYDIYNHFSFLNLNSVIISKFDETKHFGTLLNFMLLYKLPMSYFSIGQEVPDDLLLASKEYLLESFIGDLDAK
ncbi:MAG: flagellar biosynthesis protein FlhF [Epsilonproteobacteria bacterium]|nr:MAG: flagellar biosynthesis protein FlhF [Campylobacterota bacterium]